MKGWCREPRFCDQPWAKELTCSCFPPNREPRFSSIISQSFPLLKFSFSLRSPNSEADVCCQRTGYEAAAIALCGWSRTLTRRKRLDSRTAKHAPNPREPHVAKFGGDQNNSCSCTNLSCGSLHSSPMLLQHHRYCRRPEGWHQGN